MYGDDPFDSFYLDYDRLLHDNIHSISAIEFYAFVYNGKCNLTFEL